MTDPNPPLPDDHVRRKFYELAQSGPAPIASEALGRIAALYRIEEDIRGRSAEERRAIRQERTKPLIEALEPWRGGSGFWFIEVYYSVLALD